MAVLVQYGIFISFMVSCAISIETNSFLRWDDMLPITASSRETSNLHDSDISDYLRNYKGSNSDLNGASAEFMLHLFKSLIHGKELTEAVGHTEGQTGKSVLHSDTVRSFSPKITTTRRYLFTLPSLPDQEKPQLTEIRFNQHQVGQVFRKVTLLLQRNGFPKERSLKKTIGYTNAGVLDITSITSPFLYKFHGNFTIKLNVKYRMNKDGRRKNIHKIAEEPIFVMYTQDKEFLKTFYDSHEKLSSQKTEALLSSRTKRSSQGRPTGRRRKKNKWNTNEICKLHKFKVDFDLIGWGPWIVHPKRFNARVCFGQCPAPITSEYTPTNHAMLQTLMRMKRPLSAPEPCCVPTKLRPLSMLYFEYDAMVVRHHQDMIAAECGCR